MTIQCLNLKRERGTMEQEQSKYFSLKIQEATSNVSITEKKEKPYVRQIIYLPTRGRAGRFHLPAKVDPDLDFTDEPVV